MFHPVFTSAFYQYTFNKDRKLMYCPGIFLGVVLHKEIDVTFLQYLS